MAESIDSPLTTDQHEQLSLCQTVMSCMYWGTYLEQRPKLSTASSSPLHGTAEIIVSALDRIGIQPVQPGWCGALAGACHVPRETRGRQVEGHHGQWRQPARIRLSTSCHRPSTTLLTWSRFTIDCWFLWFIHRSAGALLAIGRYLHGSQSTRLNRSCID